MCIKFSIFILTGLLAIAKCDINLKEYYKMPNLHRQDDYDRCLWSNKELSTYCTVSTLVKPDPSNAIWNQIEEFSNKTKIHFAHDVLFSGHCLSECEKSLSGLTEKELEDLYVEKFPHTRKFTYNINAYRNGTLYRKMYDKIINQCENLWLRENWNLSGYSTILWCTTNEEFDHYETDYLHMTFLVVTVLILSIVAAATGLDIWQNNENSLNYYKVDRFDLPKKQQSLLCFSIVRNWYRLVAPPKTEVGRDLRFVLTVRYLTTLIIVMGHTWISYSFLPSINPEFLEQSYYTHNLLGIFFNCGQITVQTFFLASGFLLYISFSEVLKEGQLNLGTFGAAAIYRYVRLTPVYAYLILYHATYFYLSGSGAYWKFITEQEYTYCRKNWWTNLLYINNYVKTDEPCIKVSWYLAADTHLFLFALFLFMIMWKYPKYKKLTVALALFLSCVIQFLVTHLNGFDPMFLFYPEDRRFIYDNIKKDYDLDYTTSHANAGNFVNGIIGGMAYFYFKEKKIDLAKYKSFVVMWHLFPVMGFSFFAILAYIFFHTDFELPSISMSFLAICIKQMWGIQSNFLILGFFSSFRSPIKNFFHWPVFTPLSRLTYCIYLVHPILGQLLFGLDVQNNSLSHSMFLRQFLALFVVSNFAALILCLCLEFPLTGLSKILLQKNRILLATKDEDNNNGLELK